MPIPEHVMRGAPWSISKAKVIANCSQQYDYKYGPNKIKELKEYEESILGVAVHKALELALDGLPVKQAFQHAIDQLALTESETEQLNTFYEQIARFAKFMFDFEKKHGVTQKLIEKKWGVKQDFTGTQFFDKRDAPPTVFFRGVIDYGMLTAKNDLVIIDHKSGKEHPLDYYDAQFKAYAILALANIPNLRGVQTAINFIMADKTAWNKYIPAQTIRDEYHPWLMSHLAESCTKFLSPVTPTKGWWCGWCGYQPICTLFGGTGRADQQTAE